MPKMDDINRFKATLKSLGSEPQILMERAEPSEEVPVPENVLPSDLSELLDSTPADEETTSDSERDTGDVTPENLADALDLGNIEDVEISDHLSDEAP
ncbi:MAG: hypothetical protein JW881_06850, partial [Spirochaetales bacterium]|nr:hypothetical protein [Spirochaetales bacterium]